MPESVDRQISQLGDACEDVRIEAALLLASKKQHWQERNDFGEIGEQIRAILTQAIDHSDPDIAWDALLSLRSILSSHNFVPCVVALLRRGQEIRNHKVEDMARWLARLGPAAHDAVAALADALAMWSGDDVTIWLVRALGAIGPAARTAIPAIKETMEWRTSSSGNGHLWVMYYLELEEAAEEAIRAINIAEDSLIAPHVVITHRPAKREPAELEKSLLALLDTCVEWIEEYVSHRKLHGSPLLARKRSELGLDGVPTLATVGNHLRALAEYCQLESLTETTSNTRQSARFRSGTKERLIRFRPALLSIIERKSKLADVE